MSTVRAKKARPERQAGGRRVRERPFDRRPPWFAWVSVALAVAAIIILARVWPVGPSGPKNSGKLTAAIVDQLHNLQPNEAFITEVTGELESYGFEVDLYQGDEITVDFYRRLAEYGYRLILFRVHSGLVIEDGQVLPRTLLFTNEEYSAAKYSYEQLDDRLGKGSAGEGFPMMFGITAKFVNSRSMPGTFDDTVIIMMGCSAIFYTDMAEAFVASGASVYLGWHGSVNLHYVDEATPYLMQQLCSQNATIEEAVGSTMEVIGPDPRYLAELRYYPQERGNETLEQLLQIESDGEAADN